MLDVCCEVTSHDEYVAMVKTKKRMSAQPTCCYTATFATRSLLRGSVVPAKFLLWTSTRCLQNVRHQTRWLWYGKRSTTWITEGDTAQTETERILTRLVTAHSWIAVCIKRKRVFAHVIHVLTLSHPVSSSRVAHAIRRSLSTRTSRMVAELSGCSKLIHGSMTVPTEYHATTAEDQMESCRLNNVGYGKD